MKSTFLIILIGLFLVGNIHVVTDWCSDLPNNESQLISNSQNQHDPAVDLCGHCGHMGLNVLLINTAFALSEVVIQKNKPEIADYSQDSVLLPPPTPPPDIFS